MRGLKSFVADNWFSLFTIGMLLSGAIYQFGFKEAELRGMKAYSEHTRETQLKKVVEFEAVRQDVERLKWELSNHKASIDDLRVDVRRLTDGVQELRENMRVVIELLKPRATNQ